MNKPSRADVHVVRTSSEMSNCKITGCKKGVSPVFLKSVCPHCGWSYCGQHLRYKHIEGDYFNNMCHNCYDPRKINTLCRFTKPESGKEYYIKSKTGEVYLYFNTLLGRYGLAEGTLDGAAVFTKEAAEDFIKRQKPPNCAIYPVP